MEETVKNAKLFLFSLILLGLGVILLPADNAQAGQNGKECPESVLDVGMPEIEPEYSIPEEYDKENLFTDTVSSFKSGDALFRIDGFVLDPEDISQPDADVNFSTELEASQYQPDSLNKGDILKAIPSITTEDDKTLGILVPPFAYFSKKF